MDAVAVDCACQPVSPVARLERHVWQRRFKAFPIEQADHLLTVLRYIELNPVRAILCHEPNTGGGQVPVRGGSPCEALGWKLDPWHSQSRGWIG